MMDRKQNGPGIVFRFDALKLRRQESQLQIGNGLPFSFLAGDHTGIFQRVAEQPNNADEGSIESEIDTRLGRGGAVQGSCFLRDYRLGRAEIAGKDGQREIFSWR